MKARITLYSLLLATCFTSVAKDKMKITFNDASTVAYDVESITDITFTESPDDPVTPPNPSNKALVTRINNMAYTYDAQGRCTSMTLDGEMTVIYIYDYETMTLKMNNYTVGNFTLTPEGYFSAINIDFMGAKNNMAFEYNSDGYMTHSSVVSSDVDYSYEKNTELYWENNLLVKIIEHEIETENGEHWDDTYVLTLTYSQQENKTNQWTLAMNNNTGMAGHCATGMCGNAPARLPSYYSWNYDSDFQGPVSYTLNSDGSIKTETIDGDTYNYYYDSNPSASPLKKSMKNILLRLSNKIAER